MQSLGRGIAVLDALVRADGPLSATEIGRRCGIHQSTVSRVLTDLVAVGWARKVSYREFAPDFGLLSLGVAATAHFDLLARPRLAMERCAAMCSGLQVSLCMLWRGKLLYFDQTSRGFETRLFEGADYPVHLSSPGMLFMLEMPPATALRLLAESRRRWGWNRPTEAVAATEAEVLAATRVLLRNETLVLREWAGVGHVTAAIRLADHQRHPLALAISGASDVLTAESLRVRLHECRRLVEHSLG